MQRIKELLGVVNTPAAAAPAYGASTPAHPNTTHVLRLDTPTPSSAQGAACLSFVSPREPAIVSVPLNRPPVDALPVDDAVRALNVDVSLPMLPAAAEEEILPAIVDAEAARRQAAEVYYHYPVCGNDFYKDAWI
jgi:hypothetical protein